MALRRWKDGLQVLALVFAHSSAGEAACIWVLREQSCDERRAAAVQAANEEMHVPVSRGVRRVRLPRLSHGEIGSPPRPRIPMPRPWDGSRIRLTASFRERTPSLLKADERWLLTVLSAK